MGKTTSIEPGSPLEELIAELGGEAAKRSGKRFTLDRTAARKKLQDHQLQSPYHYILGLVAVARLKGATRVSFKAEGADLFATFDGRPFTASDFTDFFEVLFRRHRDDDDEALFELAIAANAAVGLRTQSFWVRSGDATGGVRFELMDALEETGNTEPVDPPGTHIHVRSRFGAMARLFDFLLRATPLEALLRQHCRFSSVPVIVGGKQISKGPHLDGGLAVVPVAADGIEGVAGFMAHTQPTGQVQLCKHGVWFDTAQLEQAPAGFCAVVDSRHLRKDLSQSNAVHDAAYEAALAAVEQAIPAALEKLAQLMAADELPSVAWKDLARTLLRYELLTRHADKAVHGPQVEPLVGTLCECRLWDSGGGLGLGPRYWTLHELLDLHAQGVVVQLCSPQTQGLGTNIKQALAERPESVRVVVADADTKTYLERVFREAPTGLSHT